MKQLTDEVFAQVRKALMEATVYIEIESSVEHSKDHQAAIAALDTAQPVQVNAMLLDALKNAEKAVELAYMEGFYDIRTYNDVQTNDENESWRASAAFVSFKYIGATLTTAQQAQPQPSADYLGKAYRLAKELFDHLAVAPAQPERAPLSDAALAALINEHFYPNMRPDFQHYKAFALEVIKQGGQHD